MERIYQHGKPCIVEKEKRCVTCSKQELGSLLCPALDFALSSIPSFEEAEYSFGCTLWEAGKNWDNPKITERLLNGVL